MVPKKICSIKIPRKRVIWLYSFVFLENTYAITKLWYLQEKCKNVYSNSKFVFKRSFNSKDVFNLRRCYESSQHHGVLKIELLSFIFSNLFCIEFAQSNSAKVIYASGKQLAGERKTPSVSLECFVSGLWVFKCWFVLFYRSILFSINPLRAKPTKWTDTLKQFVGCYWRVVWVCLTIL